MRVRVPAGRKSFEKESKMCPLLLSSPIFSPFSSPIGDMSPNLATEVRIISVRRGHRQFRVSVTSNFPWEHGRIQFSHRIQALGDSHAQLSNYRSMNQASDTPGGYNTVETQATGRRKPSPHPNFLGPQIITSCRVHTHTAPTYGPSGLGGDFS